MVSNKYVVRLATYLLVFVLLLASHVADTSSSPLFSANSSTFSSSSLYSEPSSPLLPFSIVHSEMDWNLYGVFYAQNDSSSEVLFLFTNDSLPSSSSLINATLSSLSLSHLSLTPESSFVFFANQSSFTLSNGTQATSLLSLTEELISTSPSTFALFHITFLPEHRNTSALWTEFSSLETAQSAQQGSSSVSQPFISLLDSYNENAKPLPLLSPFQEYSNSLLSFFSSNPGTYSFPSQGIVRVYSPVLSTVPSSDSLLPGADDDSLVSGLYVELGDEESSLPSTYDVIVTPVVLEKNVVGSPLKWSLNFTLENQGDSSQDVFIDFKNYSTDLLENFPSLDWDFFNAAYDIGFTHSLSTEEFTSDSLQVFYSLKGGERITFTYSFSTPSYVLVSECTNTSVRSFFPLSSLFIEEYAVLDSVVSTDCSFSFTQDFTQAIASGKSVVQSASVENQTTLPLSLVLPYELLTESFTYFSLSENIPIIAQDGSLSILSNEEYSSSFTYSELPEIQMFHSSIIFNEPVVWGAQFTLNGVDYSLSYLTPPIYLTERESYDGSEWSKSILLHTIFLGEYQNVTVETEQPNLSAIHVESNGRIELNDTFISVFYDTFTSDERILITGSDQGDKEIEELVNSTFNQTNITNTTNQTTSESEANQTNSTDVTNTTAVYNETALNETNQTTQANDSLLPQTTLNFSHSYGTFSLSTSEGFVHSFDVSDELDVTFEIHNLSYGASTTLLLDLPFAIPEDVVFYLWKEAADSAEENSSNVSLLPVNYTLSPTRDAIMFTLIDGVLDDDGLVNGIIVDPLTLPAPASLDDVDDVVEESHKRTRVESKNGTMHVDIEKGTLDSVKVVSTQTLPDLPYEQARLSYPLQRIEIAGVAPGDSVDVELSYPSLSERTVLIKLNSQTLEWYTIPYEIVNDTTVRFTLVDGGLGDDDGLPNGIIIDDVGVIDLNILNIQSYPQQGGYWEVYFNTTGEANLSIEGINTTYGLWSEVQAGNASSYDLEPTYLYCGNDSIDYDWEGGDLIRVEDYSCDSLSTWRVRVLTPGEHYQEFTFGNLSALARNNASGDVTIVGLPTTLTFDINNFNNVSVNLSCTDAADCVDFNVTAIYDDYEYIGETGKEFITGNESVWVDYRMEYNTTPIIILTPGSNNAQDNNVPIPRLISKNETGFNLSLCFDSASNTCNYTSIQEEIHYYVFDINKTNNLSWIEVGTHSSTTDGSTSTLTFGKTFANAPYVWSTAQSFNYGFSGMAPVSWMSGPGTTSISFLSCDHIGGDETCAGTTTETFGYVAIDILSEDFLDVGFGTNSVSNSAWTLISYGLTLERPRAMVTINSDNGGNDPKSPWATNYTTTQSYVRYCEQDNTADDCDTHTGEDVRWFFANAGGLRNVSQTAVVLNVSEVNGTFPLYVNETNKRTFNIFNGESKTTEYFFNATGFLGQVINLTFYLDNGNSTSINVTIDDISPPEFTSIPPNAELVDSETLDVTFNAQDNYRIESFSVNDSSVFTIYPNGSLTNFTEMNDSFYSLNITVTDTEGNENSLTYTVTRSFSVNLTLLHPLTTLAVNKGSFFNVTYNITCLSAADCVGFDTGVEFEQTEFGETGAVNLSNFVSQYVEFEVEYDQVPIVIATTATYNDSIDNPYAPVFHSINTTGFNVSLCRDNSSSTCDTSAPLEELHYFVFDVDKINNLSWIEVGNISGDTDGTITALSFSKTFSSTPRIFLNVESDNDGGNTVAPMVWADSVTTSGASLVGCHHITQENSCDTGLTERFSYVAIDVNNEEFAKFASGSEAISSSTWTSVSYGQTFTNPRIMVGVNSENGGEDGKYIWARSVTGTGADIRYCEHDTISDYCDTHNAEDTVWFVMEDGPFTVTSSANYITQTAGDVPFYTNITNPQTFNLFQNDVVTYTYFINATGDYLSNHTLQASVAGVGSEQFNITIDDFEAPNFISIPLNLTVTLDEAISVDFSAIDNDEISNFTTNDTGNFSMSVSGTLTNATNLSLGTYYLNVSVFDPKGNNNSLLYTVTVIENATNASIALHRPITEVNVSPSYLFPVVFNVTCNDTNNCSGLSVTAETVLFQKNLTINNSESTTLTNYPAYVFVSKETEMSDDFSDLRFYSDDCDGSLSTLLPYEIEDYNSSHASVWFRIPSFAPGNNSFCMVYGAGTISNDPTNVWINSYTAVYHFSETGATTNRSDSSGNNYHATPVNYGGNEAATGLAGGADLLEATNSEYLFINDLVYSTSGISEYSVCAWVNSSNTAGQIIASFDRSEYWRLALVDDTGLNAIGWDTDSSAATYDLLTSTTATDGSWHYICGIFDSGPSNDVAMYLDGVLLNQSTGHSSATLGSGTTRYGFIGVGSEAGTENGTTGPDDFLDGHIDELRLSTAARSIEWIRSTYNIQNDQANRVTFGPATLSSVGETISTTAGASPIAALSNPQAISLNNTQSQLVTFYLNVTSTVNGTLLVRGRLSNDNISDSANLTVIDEPTITIAEPASNISVVQNETFELNITLTCATYSNCSTTDVYIYYENGSLLSSSQGVTPLHTNQSSPTSYAITNDTTVNVSFLINVTGEPGESYNIRANLSKGDQTSLINVTILPNILNASILVDNPLTNLSVSQEELHNVSVNITCTDADDCNGIQVSLNYSNGSLVGTGSSETPFYITQTTNPATINVLDGNTYQLNWTLNTSGSHLDAPQLSATILGNDNVSDFINFSIIDDVIPIFTTFFTSTTTSPGTSFNFDFDAVDLSGIDTFSINDTTNFTINSAGVLTNTTPLGVANVSLNVSVNDTIGNDAWLEVNISIIDTANPLWVTIPANVTLEYLIDSLSESFVASDTDGIDNYTVNDSVNFNITEIGDLYNLTALTVGTYILNVTASDPSSNTNSTLYQVDVVDTIAPEITTIPANITLIVNANSLSESFAATDLSAVDTFFINDTTNFSITSGGLLTNITNVSVGEYYLNVSVNDTYGNTNSTVYFVNVTESPITLNLLQPTTPFIVAMNTTFDVIVSVGCINASGCFGVRTNMGYNTSENLSDTPGTTPFYTDNVFVDRNVPNNDFRNATFTINATGVEGSSREMVAYYSEQVLSDVFNVSIVVDPLINRTNFFSNVTREERRVINATANVSCRLTNGCNDVEVFLYYNNGTLVGNESVGVVSIIGNQTQNVSLNQDQSTIVNFSLNFTGNPGDDASLYFELSTGSISPTNLNVSVIENIMNYSIVLHSPLSNQTVSQEEVHTLRVNLSCDDEDDCADMQINLSYANGSLVGTSNSETPLYIIGTNEQTISLTDGQDYMYNWTLNTTGANGSTVQLIAYIEDNNNQTDFINYTVIDDVLPLFTNFFTSTSTPAGTAFSFNFDAVDLSGLDTFWINDTTNFTINSSTGVLSNATVLGVANVSLNLSVNDTVGNIASLEINISIIDSNNPLWITIPPNATLEYQEDRLNVTFVASDSDGIDSYDVNDTGNFSINIGGLLTDTAFLDVGFYPLLITVSDPSNNKNTTAYSVTVQDTTPPTFDTIPNNASVITDIGWAGVTFVASDPSGVNNFSVNNTNYTINSTGFLINQSAITLGETYLNITVNDTYGNEDSVIYFINATETGIYSLVLQYPTSDIEVIKDEFFNVTVGVYCANFTGCFLVNVGLGYNFTTLVSNTSGDTPFYTNASNNVSVNVPDGQTENITFFINASGAILEDDDMLFFVDTSVFTASFNVKIADVTNPIFTFIPGDQVLEYLAESFQVDFNATDDVAIDAYSIDSGVLFSIDENGTLVNTTAIPLGTHLINVTVNDTSGNENSTIYNLTVLDTSAPVFDAIPANLTIELDQANLSVDFNASDGGGLDTYTVNDTTYFNVTTTGLVYNITRLDFRIYDINVTVTDLQGNENSTIYRLNVTPSVYVLDESNSSLIHNQRVIGAVGDLRNVSVEFVNQSISELVVYNYNRSDSFSRTLFVRNLTNDTVDFAASDTFAIDPTNITFFEMNVTINATGRFLFKCENFSFTDLSCNEGGDDTYEPIATDMVVGQNYTFTINATDPGFGVTQEGPANTSDTYIRSGKPTTNYGGKSILRVGRKNGGNIFRSLIKFNLSEAINDSPSTTVLNATLSLYAQKIPGSDFTGNRTHILHRVDYDPPRNWTELNATWNEYRTGSSWTGSGGDFNATPIANASVNASILGSRVEFNVTVDVQAFVDNESANFGWLIKEELEGTNNYRFDYSSSNHNNAARHPQLIITFLNGSDLIIRNITFSNDNAVEGENTTVEVNVTNNATVDSVNFSVALNISVFNGSEFILNETHEFLSLNLTSLQSQLLLFNWTAQPGTWQFNATADFYDNESENNELNNVFLINYTVGTWEILYGVFDYAVLLGDSVGNNFSVWNITVPEGNIYYADTDATFNVFDLQPLNGTNDLAEADSALNTTGFNDSVASLWDVDDNSVADTTATLVVANANLSGVPIVNTTNTSSFITGLLWDSADGGSEYDGSQDLIVVSVINHSQVGFYGTYDYEARVPSPLGSLVSGVDGITRYDEVR